MKIFITKRGGHYPGSHPALTLTPDSWDDYGFKTTFLVMLWSERDTKHELSTVKVMRSGMNSGQTPLDYIYEDGLPDEYASLGADFDYYQQVASVEAFGEEILRSLRDLAIDPARYERFRSEHAFEASLHRLAPARDALRRVRSALPSELSTKAIISDFDGSDDDNNTVLDVAPLALHSSIKAIDNLREESRKPASVEPSVPLSFEFVPFSDGQELVPTPIKFDFAGPAGLPGKLIAVVGSNGTGKTTLLANLALTLFFGEQSGQGGDTPGVVLFLSGSVREVIFISYSAYDSFEIPSTQDLSGDVRSELAEQGYVYIGLRKLDAGEGKKVRPEREYILKSINEIDREFSEVLSRLITPGSVPQVQDRGKLFVIAIRKLFEDPSLGGIAQIGNVRTPRGVIKRISTLFPSLSTGHKAILNIVASLCLHLNRNSLVLMDEPEAHLHPPLIASLLRVVRDLLDSFQANAIVATHSPVVVQETLAEHVLVLRRDEGRTLWRKSLRQTFGENLAALTRETFGLPADRADYIARLRDLLQQGRSIDEVEALFGELGMSSPARAQALRILSEIRGGARK